MADCCSSSDCLPHVLRSMMIVTKHIPYYYSCCFRRLHCSNKRSRFRFFLPSKRACTFVFIFISLTQLLLRDDIVCWQENKSTQKAGKIESVFLFLFFFLFLLVHIFEKKIDKECFGLCLTVYECGSFDTHNNVAHVFNIKKFVIRPIATID